MPAACLGVKAIRPARPEVAHDQMVQSKQMLDAARMILHTESSSMGNCRSQCEEKMGHSLRCQGSKLSESRWLCAGMLLHILNLPDLRQYWQGLPVEVCA